MMHSIAKWRDQISLSKSFVSSRVPRVLRYAARAPPYGAIRLAFDFIPDSLLYNQTRYKANVFTKESSYIIC